MNEGSDGMPIYHRAPIHHSATTKEESKQRDQRNKGVCLVLESKHMDGWHIYIKRDLSLRKTQWRWRSSCLWFSYLTWGPYPFEEKTIGKMAFYFRPSRFPLLPRLERRKNKGCWKADFICVGAKYAVAVRCDRDLKRWKGRDGLLPRLFSFSIFFLWIPLCRHWEQYSHYSNEWPPHLFRAILRIQLKASCCGPTVAHFKIDSLSWPSVAGQSHFKRARQPRLKIAH